ncbi:MAG: Ig-like domain-containing protein, partial [Chloroflexi bacterium]|nr:Ig-like domain-containing protein [Chloroflexota bacterium]
VNDASAGPTLESNFEIGLDPFASTGAGYAVKGDSVRLKNGATVGGDVHYNDLDSKGTVLGALVTPLDLPVFDLLPLFIAQPPAPGSPDVDVPQDGFAVLPPGDYGDVTVGRDGTLVFSGGQYNVRSIDADRGAALLFRGPALVRVEGRLSSDRDVVVGPEAGSGTPVNELVFYVAGLNGGLGPLDFPLAAELHHDNDFQASIYAPNGTLRIGHFSDVTGAFLARDVLVENQARATLDSYFFNRPPSAEDDSATVAQGGTVTVLDSGETSVLANDTDPDLDTLTVTTTPVSGPSHGTLILNADGTFSYTHDGSETTADEFVYEACDGGAPVLCDTATVSITVLLPHTLTVVRFGLGDGRVFSTPAGIDCGAVCTALFSAAAPVALTAEAFVGSVFGGFSGDPDCADGVVTVDADTTCLARFDLDVPDAVLTVNLAGGGSGRVTSEPEGVDCPGTCSAGFPIPTRVFLTATADEGSQFAGWSGDPDCEDGIVDLFGDATCTATFEPEEARITIVRFGLGGGAVSSDPAGIDCGATCTAVFDPGEIVTLTAKADAGSEFGGFSGDPDCADGVVTAAGDKTCFARFDVAGETGLLTVTLAGDGGGRVTSEPEGIDCPGTCAAAYAIPNRVTLTPVADPGSAFAGWSGDPECAGGIVDVLGDVSCTATFVAVTP